MRKPLFVLILALGISACATPSQPPQQSNPIAANTASHEIAHQRFLPISPSPQFIQGVPWHGFFALDTQTGQLCRTTIFEFNKGGTDFNSVPTCFSLSQPSTVIYYDKQGNRIPKNDQLAIR
jgi:hypothetical protein